MSGVIERWSVGARRTQPRDRLGACLQNGNGDYGENGCTGGTEKRRTNGEDRQLTRSIEDWLSSPFNLRCSVSPVSRPSAPRISHPNPIHSDRPPADTGDDPQG